MTERQGVEIDYCPKCRGVWLDRGELDKIIERSAEGGPPQGFRGDRDDDREYSDRDRGYDPKRRKKRSFLGDLFEFD
jgi:Zn-finger nucleic acid-binding protein